MVGDFSVDARDVLRLAAKVKGADKIIGAELLTAVRGIGLDAERYAKVASPVHRGQLRRSITSKASRVGGGAEARVGTNVKYARPVEEGRRPGAPPPPTAPIAAWLRRKGGDPSRAFVVARSIGRRGITARPYLKPAAARAVAESGRHLRPAVERIRARLLA